MKQDPIEYLYSLQRFGIKLGLERMQKFMKLLSNPHTKFPSIHVTGTNGKGSVCAYLAKVLEEAGYKVGLYTSPHLVKFNERIQINGKQITDTKIAELVEYIKTNVADAHTTFFEFTTALAFVYFAQENVDIAIIEVGLGGNLDATTVITPLVSVITNISLDHTKILGETNLQIAEKKAGVIKKKIPLVTGEKDPAVLKMFETKCQELATEVIPTSSYTILENCNGLQKFEFLNSTYQIAMQGTHQIENACTALTVLEQLRKKEFEISPDAIHAGLKKTSWPGRLQVISQKPLIIVDGAHNPDAMNYLADYAQDNLTQRKVLLLGVSKGRDVGEMVKHITPLFDHIIITQSSFKPEETSVISAHTQKYNSSVEVIEDLKEAVDIAITKAQGGTLLITGSLYLVGDVLSILKN